MSLGWCSVLVTLGTRKVVPIPFPVKTDVITGVTCQYVALATGLSTCYYVIHILIAVLLGRLALRKISTGR